MFKISRNAPCFCDSNLKYKKCCLNKPFISDISNLEIVNFIEENQFLDGRMPLNEAEVEFMVHYEFALNRAMNTDTSIDQNYIDKLHALYEKNSHHPDVLAFLIDTYYIQQQHEEGDRFLEELIIKFPQSSINALRLHAFKLMSKSKYDEAYQLFGKYNHIKELCTNRTIFDIHELFNFHAGLLLYCIKTDDNVRAARHQRNIDQLALLFSSDLAHKINKLKSEIYSVVLHQSLKQLIWQKDIQEKEL
jgi:hypothetical protein